MRTSDDTLDSLFLLIVRAQEDQDGILQEKNVLVYGQPHQD